MVVALVALTVALSGTAVVADYARNAGQVDGRSAVSASASLRSAAGNVVATASGGNNKGRIPDRYLANVMRGASTSVTRYLRVTDNQPGPVVPLAIIPGIGRLDAQCRDQDLTAGVESTQTMVTFTGTDPVGVNVSRLLGRDLSAGRDGVVFTAMPNQPVAIMSFADSLFQLILQAKDKTVFISGAARSDANRTAAAACLIWGVGFRVGG